MNMPTHIIANPIDVETDDEATGILCLIVFAIARPGQCDIFRTDPDR